MEDRTSRSVDRFNAVDVPHALSGVDVLVNPSLRAWSETYCIANVEAMAMGVPLVTFAAGGVGEYVTPPAKMLASKGADRGFAPSVDTGSDDDVRNAIVVDDPSPEGLAEGVWALVANATLRQLVGSNARRTVLRHFSEARQMRMYEELYWEGAATG